MLRRAWSIRTLAIVAVFAACVARELELSSSQEASTIALQNFDFGTQQVTTTSGPHPFVISPTSGMTDNDIVNSISAQCPDFQVTATGLPAMVTNTCNATNGSGQCIGFAAMPYTFTAVFQPTSQGPTNCPVTVTIDGVASTFTLIGTGTAPPIVFAVSPATVPFNDIRVTVTSSPQTVTIDDLGSDPGGMTVTSVALDAAAMSNGYKILTGNMMPHVVVPGVDDVYTLTCTPPAEGDVPGNLIITSNDQKASPATVKLACNGIKSNLQIDPSPALLVGTQPDGATRVGEPIDMDLLLTNKGTASLVLDSFTTTGADLSIGAAPPGMTTLAANASVKVTVHYAATVEAPLGGKLGTVDVTLDDVTTQHRSVTINGGALATSMAINGPPLTLGNFGPVCLHTPATQMISVRAKQAGGFVINKIDTPSTPFQIDPVAPPQMPTMAAPTPILGGNGGTAEFTITATPTELGSASGSFTVETDIPAGAGPGSQTVPLTVIGLADGVTASPPMVDFGQADVGATSGGQMVTLTNCSAGPLTLGSATITGADALDFVVVLPPASSTIAANASAGYVIAMEAKQPGTRQATLEVDYDGGSATVDLIGVGSGDASGDTGDKSYYSCAASTNGGWPAVVAIGLVLRRRRRR